ncbi:MAG: ABC transporter substrate-binding protein [Gammaproteobacteria bacterium]|nr:ABC transporter substrate-binding protein [Gammaproteobacteria bacterium]
MAQKTKKFERNYSRREFIKTSSLTIGAIGALASSNQILAQNTEIPKTSSEGLPIIMAGYKFNRIEALFDGRVKIEGCHATISESKIGDMNTDMFSGPQTNDVTEIGLHPFMIAYANGNFRDYTLLPIFPLRLFRHRSVFIRTDRGIKKPEDLRGKTIATPGYSSTSLTWIRGIFQDEYGIKPEEINWVTASNDSSADLAGKISKQEMMAPEGISISVGPAGKDESDLLESGHVDALFHAAEPRAYIERHPKIGRLFPDFRSVEQAYYAKTGIFPIMHTMAIKKSTLKQNPWLAEAVFNAFSQAKQINYQWMVKQGWLMDSLPWYGQEVEETRTLMGDNFYSYGIESNRKALEALFRYSHQQGLTSRELTIEELFAPESLKLVETSF